MNKIFGIDISEWQMGFDFKKAKSEGVKFAIIRAGYTGSGNGTSKAKDKCFESHYKNAKNNGIQVGAYWFSRATTYANGQAEAEYMYKNCLKGKQFEYPIAIDVEDTKYQSKASKKAVAEAVKGFCEYLEGKGYYVSVYANSNWFKNKIDSTIIKPYDKWLANWSKSNPASPMHGMWQFGGSSNYVRTNKVAGVVCDQDYAYKDYPGIMLEKGLNGYIKKVELQSQPESTPAPKLEPAPTPNPTTSSNALAEGNKVKIIGTGKETKDGGGKTAYGIGWTRKIKKIYPSAKYPYKVGNDSGTTGYYKASALKKI